MSALAQHAESGENRLVTPAGVVLSSEKPELQLLLMSPE